LLGLSVNNEFYFSPTGAFLGNGLGEVYANASGFPQPQSGNDGSVPGPGYPEGTPVTITAVPDEGYVFDGWSSPTGDCTAASSATCVLTMTHNAAVVAKFTVAVYNLTVTNRSPTDGGVIDGVGDINCGGAGSPTPSMCSGQEAAQHVCRPGTPLPDCSAEDGSQSEVELRARAIGVGVKFGRFDGCDTSAPDPVDPTIGYCFIDMRSDRSVTINWNP
jgi:hypothetical protein